MSPRGFGYTVIGFAARVNGDQNRLEPITQMLRKSPAFVAAWNADTDARIATAKL